MSSVTEGEGGYVFTPVCLLIAGILRISAIMLVVCVCHSVCLCLSVVHPPSAQVLQSNLIKLGHMDHWGTLLCTFHIGPDPPPRGGGQGGRIFLF